MMLYGFTDNMPPMKRGKTEKALETYRKYTRVSYDGKSFTYPEWIRHMLKSGSIPCIATNHKGKPEYRMYVASNGVSAEEKRYYQELTKTQYEFALYLQSAGLVSDEASEAWQAEEQKRELEVAAQAECERRAQQEHEAEFREFQDWMGTEAMRLAEQQPERIAKLESIYMNKTGTFHPRMARLLVAIDHFDDQRCRNWLASSGALYDHNKGSRAAFKAFTGQKLPTGNKKTTEFIMGLESLPTA